MLRDNLENADMSRLMTLKQIQAEKLPVANSRFYEWLAAGQMPKPVKVGKRNLWPEHEIDGWLQELIGRRDRGEMALPMSPGGNLPRSISSRIVGGSPNFALMPTKCMPNSASIAWRR
jgi:predicted DNA-binding transcriptional regulator AlpA